MNATKQACTLSATEVVQLANRHIGIGFDQLLIIESAKNADFFCKIYNSDGSEAEQCGNGLRCVARFIHEEKLHADKSFRVETKAGIYPIEIKDYDHIRVSMGAPQIKKLLTDLTLTDHLNQIPVSILSLGNPHAITKVDSINLVPLALIAPQIAAHDSFPDGVNVGFMQVINKNHIRLRTFERGAGETFACGSNACAAAVAGIANDWVQTPVQVEFKYGSLWIDWNSDENIIQMTGPATKVFKGIW
jgi:diaminopimelate epimerase